LRCVCGDPIELLDETDPTSWIHSPGSDTPCLDARPYEEVEGAAWRAESHRIAERKIREAVGGLYAEVGFRVMDALEGRQREDQAARDALARVRRLHDSLAEETDLASPDDEITRGMAARKIAAALDGWTPPQA
jgi:hypothetical protein